MRLYEFCLWAGLVGLDVWLWTVMGPPRWKGYGSALLLSMGLYWSDWGSMRPIRCLVLIGVVLAVSVGHELILRGPSLIRRKKATATTSAQDGPLVPTRESWDRLNAQFRKYDGDLEVQWTHYPRSNRTEWSIPPRRDTARRIQEFTADATRAGLLARAMGPRPTKFPVNDDTAPEDYWLMLLLTEIDALNDWTVDGSDPEHGNHKGGFIKDAVHASAVECKRLAMEVETRVQATRVNAGSVSSTIS